MFSLDKLLKEVAPRELFDFVSKCKNGDDFVQKLESDPLQLCSFIRSMNMDGNERLAAQLLYRVSSDFLDNPQVKKVETMLRNNGLLNRKDTPDITLNVEGSEPIVAHKSILVLGSPYFKAMNDFGKFKDGKIELKDEEFSSEAYMLAVDYLYSSDEKRKDFVSTVDKSLLLELAKLSSFWQIDGLDKLCDDELCSSIGDMNIAKSDMEAWLTLPDAVPKFTKLLSFVNRVSGDGDLEPIIDQMQTPVGAAWLAAKCTQEEIKLFATMKTEFGKACQIPPGTFGIAMWEKTFPVTIEEVPPLPVHIDEILEQEDPCEPGKKLKETCQLFLRPEKVIFQGKELTLGFAGVEELAINATNKDLLKDYAPFNSIKNDLNNIPVGLSKWVLMRKEVIPGSRKKSFDEQTYLLKDRFQVPWVMDLMLINIITYASTGKYFNGEDPWAYTSCEEKCKRIEIEVLGSGLTGSWTF